MDILVPTDFSACAEYALEAAVLMAKKNKDAVIHFLHVVEPFPTSKTDFLDDAMIQKEMNQEKENALILMAALHDEHPGPTYKIHVEVGKVIDVIEDFAEKIDADLIIVGSHGASEDFKLYMGSNAQKIVRKIRRKILVVKDSFKSANLNEVVFASGFNTSERPAMLEFKNFVQSFAKKVHLVYINTNLFFGLPKNVIRDVMKEAETAFHPLEVETHYFNDYTIEEGIERISKKLGTGLIGISNFSKKPLKRIFSGSNVEALVNHSDLPVLSIDFQPVED